MFKPILGVDVSKLDLSISLLIDKKYYQTKIDNNQQGFKNLIKWLQKYGVTKVTACMVSLSTKIGPPICIKMGPLILKIFSSWPPRFFVSWSYNLAQ